MSTARSAHTANLLPDGRVLVVGGFGVDKDPIDSAEVFDPVAGTWSSAGTLQEARTYHTATSLPDGKVLVAGGLGEFTTTEMYDPNTGAWSAAAELSQARNEHTAQQLEDGSVMITGGFEGGQDGRRSDSVELYDMASGTWITVGPSPVVE
jgi:hypothetical protein